MSTLQWTPEGLQELIEDLLLILEPNGRLRPYLFLAANDRETAVPLDELLFKNGNQRFIRNTLPLLVGDFGATRAAFVSTSWTVAFSPDDLKASYSYRLHVANGGTLSTWPGRAEAVVMYVVEAGTPSWAIVGLVERHHGHPPTISEWDVSDVAQGGPIVTALEQGVRGAQVIPIGKARSGRR